MKTIKIEIDDKEYDFIEKARMTWPKTEEAGAFERFLIRTGIIGFIKHVLTGNMFGSENADATWAGILDIILQGYDEWLSRVKLGAEKMPPSILYG